MSKVIIPQRTDDPVALYDDEDQLVGDIENLNQVMDVCAQIKQKGLKGYRFKAGDIWIIIDQKGDFDPRMNPAFFPNFQKQMDYVQ